MANGISSRILNKSAWVLQRKLASEDPGGFHGEIAKRTVFWFDKKLDAWIRFDEKSAKWIGFSARTGEGLGAVPLDESSVPWTQGFNPDDAPYFRWFQGGLTNAGFSEVDAHVLSGHGSETAVIFEDEGWDEKNDKPVATTRLTRSELLVEVAKYGLALKKIGLSKGDRIILNLPNAIEQFCLIEACKRAGIIYSCVFGGLSAKTIAERIFDLRAKAAVCASKYARSGLMVKGKAEFLDRALDEFIDIETARALIKELFVAAGGPASGADKAADGFANAFFDETVIEIKDFVGFAASMVKKQGLSFREPAAIEKRARDAGRAATSVRSVIVVDQPNEKDLKLSEGRDHKLSALMKAASDEMGLGSAADILRQPPGRLASFVWKHAPPAALDADFPMFVAYTSGSTGKPKGIVHTHGGYSVGCAHSMKVALGADAGADTIYCIADPGWITGQSYMICAPLINRVTTVVAACAPLYPTSGRFASIIERHGVTILKAGSTFLRTVASDPMSLAEVAKFDLDKLKVATFCAEPTSPKLQQFGMDNICANYINSYWATEHGGIILTHFFGVEDQPLKSDTHASALPWVFADVWIPIPEASDEVKGPRKYRAAKPGEKGEIVITRPYPYLARTIWGDVEAFGSAGWKGAIDRFRETYFSHWLGANGETVSAYTQGDFACKYEDGSFTLHGRSDEVINTAGHRIGTEEIEGALLKDRFSHPGSPLANAVVVGAHDETLGQIPVAFVLLREGATLTSDDELRLSKLVLAEKGEVAVPAAYIPVQQLPETRSGKYLRRYLKAFLNDEPIGDSSMLKNPEALEGIQQSVADWKQKRSAGVGKVESVYADSELTARVEAASQDRKGEILLDYLRKELAEVLQIEAEDVREDVPLRESGLTSLRAVNFMARLRRAVGGEIGKNLSATVIFNYPTVLEIAGYLSREVYKLEVKQNRRRFHDQPGVSEPVAIVGLGCRFPGGVSDPESFWKLLSEGRDAISDIPSSRWKITDYFNEDREAAGSMYVRSGGFLESVDKFDADFFNISPREATALDPQHRLLLETVWEAFENACIVPSELKDTRASVFVGITTKEYAELLERSGERDKYEQYIPTGNNLNTASGRLSYFLNLKGPAVSVDTACSSSLVALHLGCQSLKLRESDIAIVAGVNLMLTPSFTVNLCRTNALATDGRCKTFDESADGYGRSEGCGVVILKPLSRALRDGDNILALVASTAVNQDGRSSGLTAPNGLAQEDLIREALEKGQIAPRSVSYVEAHGTGTPLGDPIEVQALGNVYGEGRAPNEPLMLGSVKTNIGHTESAAGIAGVIKTVLALQNKRIPANLHFKNLNPQIRIDHVPATIPTAAVAWQPIDGSRIAGISSFGFSGTNAHALLKEAPPTVSTAAKAASPRQAHLLCLSAKSAGALAQLAGRYADLLERKTDLDLEDVCYTAYVGRSKFSERLAIVARSRAEMIEKLKEFAAGREPNGARVGTAPAGKPKIAFLFTGQGSQYSSMSAELYRTQPAFKGAMDRCASILKDHIDRPLLDLVFEQGKSETLDRTKYTQPALFAVEYSLAVFWKSLGVEPSAVIGHSVGELVAACVAGVYSLEDGLKLISTRARLMDELKGEGAMAAVIASESIVKKEIEPFGGKVSIAAINGPGIVTISGFRTEVDAVLEKLKAKGIRSKPLVVSHAFHSAQMDPMLGDFGTAVGAIKMSPPKTTLISNLTGKPAGAEICSAQYWKSHVREAVRFGDGIETLVKAGCKTLLEVGPDNILSGMAKSCIPDDASVALLTSLKKGRPDSEQMLDAAAGLFVSGVQLDWRALDAESSSRRKVALPKYPFQGKRYWVEPGSRVASNRRIEENQHPLLGPKLQPGGKAGEVFYQVEISSDDPAAFLGDHFVFGTVVVPATTFIDMVFSGAEQVFGKAPIVIEGMSVVQPLILRPNERKRVQLSMSEEQEAPGQWRWQVLSQPVGAGSEWKSHCSGKVAPYTDAVPSLPSHPIKDALARCGREHDTAVFYKALYDGGLELGPRFRGIKNLKTGENEAVGRLELVSDLEGEDHLYSFHPSHLDCTQQVATSIYSVVHANLEKPRGFLPVAFEKVILYKRPSRNLWSHVLHKAGGGLSDKIMKADIRILDMDESLVAEYHAFTMVEAPREALKRMVQREEPQANADNVYYEVSWRANEQTQQMPALASSSLLVIADKSGFGNALAERARGLGAKVEVISGAVVSSSDDNAFDDLVIRALGELVGGGAERLMVAFTSGLDHGSTAPDALSAEALLDSQRAIYWRALRTAQLLIKQPQFAGAKCAFVTRGAKDTGESGAKVFPAQATLWGLAPVIPMEYPDLATIRIDLDPATADVASELDSVLKEMTSKDGDDQVAYRAQKRKVARLAKYRLPSGENRGIEKVIRGDSTYLITGGLGGLGLSVAAWIARHGARSIVLLGRRAPDAETLAKLQKIESESGAKLKTFAVDIGVESEVAKVIAEIERTLPPLRGVVHAAGVLSDCGLMVQDWKKFLDVASPKIKGAWNLHRATAKTSLDFFVNFSSATSLIGNRGQANYAAANAFLDSFSYFRRANGLPSVSVNWGPWKDSGMADRTGAAQRQLAEMGFEQIPLEEGLEVFGNLLIANPVQVGVLK